MRPIFCGNFEYDARQSDLERLFRRYGKVDRVDMKSGFAFVYMDDERDAKDAIRALDQIEFGRKGRRLRVEWTKQERSTSRRPEITRKPPPSNSRPTKTLFVINFDPYNTRQRDLERHFDPYGKILNIRIRKNFAFIQFETQEDATKALDATNMSKLMDRVITVEYAIKDDDERRNGHSPDRTRDRSPRRGYDRARSSSPRVRERASPDYGHGRARGRSRSPYNKERTSPDYARRSSRSPSQKGRDPEYARGRSPSPRKEMESKRSSSPQRERSTGNIVNGSDVGKKVRPDYGYSPSASPERDPGERVVSPADYSRERSPAYSDGEIPPGKRYASESPPARKRS